jgi:hypothetical protein
MRLPAHPILVSLLAGAAATVAVVIGACADPDTQTPSCVDNVDQYGEHPATNGCEGFATCPSGAPATCCMADAGVPLTGNDLATCLHGYGDPACSYIITTISGTSGTNVTYTCSANPPSTPSGDAGSDGG